MERTDLERAVVANNARKRVSVEPAGPGTNARSLWQHRYRDLGPQPRSAWIFSKCGWFARCQVAAADLIGEGCCKSFIVISENFDSFFNQVGVFMPYHNVQECNGEARHQAHR